ncbi:MAG TPA: hypothetical protein VL727_29210 [Puia sp.]|jgi:hypothetical protein|nr:hypothetical protein [Puia sp.]
MPNTCYDRITRQEYETAKEAKRLAKDFDVAPDGSPVRWAFCVLLFMVMCDVVKPLIIGRRLGMNPKDVRIIIDNWTSAGFYDPNNRTFTFEFDKDGELDLLGLTLVSAVGAGQLKSKREQSTPDPPTPTIEEIMQEIEELERKRNAGPYEFMK